MDDLDAIRARDAESGATWFTGPASFTAQGARDRRALLTLVDRPAPTVIPLADGDSELRIEADNIYFYRNGERLRGLDQFEEGFVRSAMRACGFPSGSNGFDR